MNIPHIFVRFYEVPPESKPLSICLCHGSSHKAFGWAPQIDPRWSFGQVKSYLKGYGKLRRIVKMPK
jgi:hypothetical protein